MDALDGNEAGFLIPYEHLYHTVFSNYKPLFYILVSIWIVVLFYTMYAIADRHFTWSLEYLAKTLRLSQDIAGMTLLAFGNGAPDFFTAVLGAGEEPEMILGSSVGSGLFILTVVFGMVLLFAKPAGLNRLTVKDDGTITESTKNHDDTWQSVIKCSAMTHRVEAKPFLRSVLMYLLCVIVLSLFSMIQVIPFWMPLILLGVFFLYLGLSIAFHFRSGKQRIPSKNSSIAEIDAMVKERQTALLDFQSLPFYYRPFRAFFITCWEDKWSSSWSSVILRGIVLFVKAPVNLALNLTILPVEDPNNMLSPEIYVALRYLHRLRCVLNPFFSIPLYMFFIGPSAMPVYLWGVGLGMASLFSFIIYMTTSLDGRPKLFSLHVAYAFTSSILWIYATSGELVSCLSSTGHLLSVSPTIIGILILAWGNSFGDLITDVSIARNGQFETAVTAIFSGPVQNVLLTIGTSFLVAAIRSQDLKIVIASMRFDIYLALFLLIFVILGLLVLVIFVYDFMIPRNLGFGLLTLYFVYLPFSILLGLDVIQIPFFS